jgi:carbonic anhydrase/acetyltransferase-like protein (isoleucine patch superfamily)
MQEAMKPWDISKEPSAQRILNLGTGEFEDFEHRNVVYTLGARRPVLGESVHHSAQVIGNVRLGAHSSVWCNAVVRGDGGTIHVGEGSNIQDNAVIHTGPGCEVWIGSGVTIGHGAIVHGCIIGDNCLIGNNATVLDGAALQENTMVAASAIVGGGKVYDPGILLMGSPARRKRELSPADLERIRRNALRYVEHAGRYRRELRKTFVTGGAAR